MEFCATNFSHRAEHHLFRSIMTWGQDSHHQRLGLGWWWTFTCPCPTDVGYGTHAWCTGDIDHKRAFLQRFVSKKGEKVVGKFKWLRFLFVGGRFFWFEKCKCVDKFKEKAEEFSNQQMSAKFLKHQHEQWENPGLRTSRHHTVACSQATLQGCPLAK